MIEIIGIVIISAIVGSFLNMLIYRLPQMMRGADISPLYPQRSICPHCGNTLKTRHLIPVLSYLFYKGKCNYCGNPIGISYLLVEIITIISSISLYMIVGLEYDLLFFLLLSYGLITLFFIDYKEQLLPDIITLPLLWLGLLYHLFFGDIYSSLLGAVVGYLSLWSIYWLFKLLRNKEGMGYGDFKLFALIGAWLGWQSLNYIALIAAVLGIIYFVVIVRDKHTPFAFGTHLILAMPLYVSIFVL